jgi:hypothetical protein
MNRLRFFATLFGAVLAPVYARLPSKLATPVYQRDYVSEATRFDRPILLKMRQMGDSTTLAAMNFSRSNATQNVMTRLLLERRPRGKRSIGVPIFTKRVTGPPYSA